MRSEDFDEDVFEVVLLSEDCVVTGQMGHWQVRQIPGRRSVKMGSRVSINTHAYICTKQIQRKCLLGEVYCGSEGGEKARQNQWEKKAIKNERDEGNRREESMCLTRGCHLCCMRERGKKRRGGREERSKGKDLRVPANPKSAQRTPCCYS